MKVRLLAVIAVVALLSACAKNPSNTDSVESAPLPKEESSEVIARSKKCIVYRQVVGDGPSRLSVIWVETAPNANYGSCGGLVVR